LVRHHLKLQNHQHKASSGVPFYLQVFANTKLHCSLMTCAFVIFAASSDSSHLQADCLESGISSGPLPSITSMGTFTFSGSLGIVRAYLLI